MTVPSWWGVILLGVAAYRVWRLLAEDSILDGPRRYVTGYAHDFLTCPWCAGFWIALGWWGAWQAWPHPTLVAAGALVIATVVGILGALID